MEQTTRLTGPDLAVGVAMSDLPESVPLLGHAHGEAVVLVRTGSDVRAVGATCSHYGGPLAEGLVVGETLRCPWHHACFDLSTGDAYGAPALNPVACYEVECRGDRVTVGPKKSRLPAPPPLTSPENVVIVGAGAAGAAATERLRHLGYAGPITLIGNEASGLVDRPNLSKDFLAGTAPEEWVSLRSPKFYEKIGVDLIIDDTVVELQPEAKFVVLRSGRTLSYDALLLSTGAEPLRLPIEGASLPHVLNLRTLEDARSIIAAAKLARRAVIVGSSFIGLEVAASLRARNLDVDVVSRDRLPLERVLGAQLGRFLQDLHEEHGIRFHLASTLRAIHPHAVELDDGHMLAADLVVLGVGVRPRTDLAEKAGLEVGDGIIVDSLLRTSAPRIWAAGDVACYPEPRSGTSVRIEHWVVAQRQGQAVARDMLGLGAPFQEVPFFWSQHYDVKLAYVGHANGEADIEVAGSFPKRDATVIYRTAGRIGAIVTIGRDVQSLSIEAALERNDEAGADKLLKAHRQTESERTVQKIFRGCLAPAHPTEGSPLRAQEDTMLSSIKNLSGCRVLAADGEVGTVAEAYFDDEQWVVRYLVVDTGGWLRGRQVLISPYAVKSLDPQTRVINVDLTREQVERSPGIDTHQPVSRRQEAEYHRYYGYPRYWPYSEYWAWGAVPLVVPANQQMRTNVEAARRTDEDQAGADGHLRSSKAVRGYRIQASDDMIGHVADFLFDEETWAIRYLIADTRNWLPGKHVLIAPQWIGAVSWEERTLSVALTRRQIEQSPEYEPGHFPSHDYEKALHHHYPPPDSGQPRQ